MTGPWPIPVEVIKRLASPTGVSSIIKASLRGAVLKPMGRISIRGGHFIGEIDCTLIELNPEYAEISRARIAKDAGMFSSVEVAA